MPLKSTFLGELQRRNVHRAAMFYAAAAWLLVQIATQVFPFFDIPNSTVRIVVIAVVIGFPFAMLFSWFYEWTPQGIKLESEIDRSESVTRQTGKTLDRWIIAVLALAVVVLLANVLIGRHTEPVELDRSIAVLPFVNMSGDAANEYFSDGISEEILNVLARAPELRVAARTSSFSFKGKTLEIPDIAQALGVRMVLEGSVRKQGERVRITAQLIDASNGFHVWSQTYDRKLEDIFAIQDEIATAIGKELEVKLGNPEQTGSRSTGTSNVAAYDLYLRGIALWHARRPDTSWQAVDLFTQATVTDPTFAAGHAGLALVYSVLPAYSARMSFDEGLKLSTDAALRALALDPALPEAYAALGNNSANSRQRLTSDALLRRAILLRPSFATAHQWLGINQFTSGQLAAGLEALERATLLDPRSPVIAENHAFSLLTLGRVAEASQRCEQLLAFVPNHPSCLQYVGLARLMLGDLDAAKSAFERMEAAQARSGQTQALIDAFAGRADRHALAVKMAALPFNSQADPASGNTLEDQVIAALLMMLGEPGLALDYIERIAGEIGASMDWAVMLPAMDPIRCEPRFAAVIQDLRTHDPYASKVCAGKGEP
ncbi:hypothetical protein [Nevskia sp.]|uniref:tetratricopeptide repeat protein n=1 Tax=Nevskia sp. TaxID=1929292 RepID=UPI0025DA03D5|nr:hypothetical protein [Nevskia sp.]